MTLWLDDRAVIALSGPEARDFLQGLVTNDVTGVTASTSRYAALLTPQGKILFDVIIHADSASLFLDCPASSRDALARRLSLYRLRAKVDIAPREDLAVVQGGADAPADPRHPALGGRTVLTKAQAPADPGGAPFEALRLDAGIPEGKDFGQDRMFALDADLDELHGVAFAKGCYVGQELTARMKHRGTARKRLLPIATANGAPLPPESAVEADGREIGTVASTYGPRGFALIRLDRLEDAKDSPRTAAGVPVRITKPDWLFP